MSKTPTHALRLDQAIEIVETLQQACEEFLDEYEASKDGPDQDGWKPSDTAREFCAQAGIEGDERFMELITLANRVLNPDAHRLTRSA